MVATESDKGVKVVWCISMTYNEKSKSTEISLFHQQNGVLTPYICIAIYSESYASEESKNLVGSKFSLSYEAPELGTIGFGEIHSLPDSLSYIETVLILNWGSTTAWTWLGPDENCFPSNSLTQVFLWLLITSLEWDSSYNTNFDQYLFAKMLPNVFFVPLLFEDTIHLY